MARRRSKDPSEHYVTPPWCVDRLCEQIDFASGVGGVFVDPCCGPKARIANVVQYWHPAPGGWRIADINSPPPGGIGFTSMQCDYLGESHGALHWPAEACFMNPPFSLALQFAQRALTHCRRVYMLQRLNWLASQERHEWLRDNTPSVFVLPNRPDFTGGGGDSHDYAWFAWGYDTPFLRILNTTPLSVRRSQKSRRAAHG